MTTGAVKESLELLVLLQDKDRALDQLREEAAELDHQVRTQQELLAAEKNRLALAHEQGKQIALARKAKELELAEKEAAIQKHQGELNAVKTNEAFKALLHEIDRAKAEKDAIEDAILGLLEQSDAVLRAEKEEQVLIQKLEAETAARVAELEARKPALEERRGAVAAEREHAAARLSPDLLTRYEGIRSRRKGVALAAALKDGCGGCHMALPPQLQIEVRKGGALTFCPNCQRILFVQQ